MTQEEKFKEAKRLYETANADQKYVLERLFPELKESEGETMRKVAIEACKYMADNFENSTQWYEDAIAWLEKGEQKPAWSEEEIEKCAREAEDDNCIILANHIRQLKSLRPQNTWKPSEGQLECLGYAIEKVEKDWSPLTNNRIYLTLKALKEQLEKLKE